MNVRNTTNNANDHVAGKGRRGNASILPHTAKRPKFPRDERGLRIVGTGPIALVEKDAIIVRRHLYMVALLIDGARLSPDSRWLPSFDLRREHAGVVARFLCFLAARSCLPRALENLGLRHFNSYMQHLADKRVYFSVSAKSIGYWVLRSFYENCLGKRNCIGSFWTYFGEDPVRCDNIEMEATILA